MEKEIRNHFSSVIVNTLKASWILIVLLVLNLLPEFEEAGGKIDTATMLVGTIALFLIILGIFLFQFFRWRKTYIYIEDQQLVIDRRTMLVKNKTTVRLSSIASVNLQKTLLQRLFHTYSLQLDINSAATADSTDFKLVFEESVALAFKQRITQEQANIQGADTSAGAVPIVNQEEVTPLVSFSFAQVVRHCLLSISISGILVSIGLLVLLIWMALDIPEGEAFSPISVLISIAIVGIPMIIQCISPFIRYYGFSLGKTKDRIVVSYGLLTKQMFYLPLNKTNALILRQSFLARLAGMQYGEMINVGMGDEESHQSPVFCLMMPAAELQEVIHQIAPQYRMETPSIPSPSSALLPVFIRYALWGLLLLIPLIFVGLWWLGCLLYVFILLAAFASYKTKAIALDPNKFAITSGIFSKHTIITTYSKLQKLKVTHGPISKSFGLCKGNMTILAALQNRDNAIGYFKAEEFDRITQNMILHESIET